MRLPLRRTWPASTKAAASLRVRSMRACQSHLSMRWRSKRHRRPLGLRLLLLELLLERGELGEGRIGIRLLVAARRRRRRAWRNTARARRGRGRRRGGGACRRAAADRGPAARRAGYRARRAAGAGGGRAGLRGPACSSRPGRRGRCAGSPPVPQARAAASPSRCRRLAAFGGRVAAGPVAHDADGAAGADGARSGRPAAKPR